MSYHYYFSHSYQTGSYGYSAYSFRGMGGYNLTSGLLSLTSVGSDTSDFYSFAFGKDSSAGEKFSSSETQKEKKAVEKSGWDKITWESIQQSAEVLGLSGGRESVLNQAFKGTKAKSIINRVIGSKYRPVLITRGQSGFFSRLGIAMSVVEASKASKTLWSNPRFTTGEKIARQAGIAGIAGYDIGIAPWVLGTLTGFGFTTAGPVGAVAGTVGGITINYIATEGAYEFYSGER